MGVCGSKQQGESQAAVAPTPARAAAPASSTIQPYVPDCLVGAIFVGQTSTALGSIASSIGAAELYDGIPARGSVRARAARARLVRDSFAHAAPCCCPRDAAPCYRSGR